MTTTLMTPLAFAKKYYELDVYLYPQEAHKAGPKNGLRSA